MTTTRPHTAADCDEACSSCYRCYLTVGREVCTRLCAHAEEDDATDHDWCPGCERLGVLADEEAGITFDEPVCAACRAAAIRDSSMDAFDRDYARAIANGWAD